MQKSRYTIKALVFFAMLCYNKKVKKLKRGNKMKKKLFLFTFIVMALVCVLAISVSAEIAYINANGEQVSAEATDIAYELDCLPPHSPRS